MATSERVNRKRGYRSSDDRYDTSRNRNNRRNSDFGNEYNRSSDNYYNDDEDSGHSFSNSENHRDRQYGYIDTDHQIDDNRRRRRYSFDDYRDNHDYNRSRENRQNDQDESQWEFRNDNNVHTYYGQGNSGYGSYSQQDADNGFSYNKKNEQSSYGLHRGKGPKGYNRSDERIREDINDRLSDHSHVDASDIEVDVKNGEVTLRGFVQERRAKRIAEDIAEGVSGVKNVENRIRIGTSSTFAGSDSSTEGSQKTGEGSTTRRKAVSSPMGNGYGSGNN